MSQNKQKGRAVLLFVDDELLPFKMKRIILVKVINLSLMEIFSP
jgi:hypothetical protein